MTETQVLKIRELGKDQYVVLRGDSSRGSLLYRRMSEPEKKPYEVWFDKDGQPRCTCIGFRHHGHCKHSDDLVDLAPVLVEEMEAGQELFKSKAADSDSEEVPEGRIARADLEEIVDAILSADRSGFEIEVAGSWRRGKPHVGDLDFVTTASPEDIRKLFGDGLDTSADGPRVIRFEIDVSEDRAVQIDFTLTSSERWGSALMYLTGSKDFNIWMRRRAKSRGMKLTRNGLLARDDESMLAGDSEHAIFRRLGMDFVPPSARDEEAWLDYQRD